MDSEETLNEIAIDITSKTFNRVCPSCGKQSLHYEVNLLSDENNSDTLLFFAKSAENVIIMT